MQERILKKNQQMTKKRAEMLRRQKVKSCLALGVITEVVPDAILSYWERSGRVLDSR